MPQTSIDTSLAIFIPESTAHLTDIIRRASFALAAKIADTGSNKPDIVARLLGHESFEALKSISAGMPASPIDADADPATKTARLAHQRRVIAEVVGQPDDALLEQIAATRIGPDYCDLGALNRFVRSLDVAFPIEPDPKTFSYYQVESGEELRKQFDFLSARITCQTGSGEKRVIIDFEFTLANDPNHKLSLYLFADKIKTLPPSLTPDLKEIDLSSPQKDRIWITEYDYDAQNPFVRALADHLKRFPTIRECRLLGKRMRAFAAASEPLNQILKKFDIEYTAQSLFVDEDDAFNITYYMGRFDDAISDFAKRIPLFVPLIYSSDEYSGIACYERGDVDIIEKMMEKAVTDGFSNSKIKDAPKVPPISPTFFARLPGLRYRFATAPRDTSGEYQELENAANLFWIANQLPDDMIPQSRKDLSALMVLGGFLKSLSEKSAPTTPQVISTYRSKMFGLSLSPDEMIHILSESHCCYFDYASDLGLVSQNHTKLILDDLATYALIEAGIGSFTSLISPEEILEHANERDYRGALLSEFRLKIVEGGLLQTVGDMMAVMQKFHAEHKSRKA